MRDGVKGKDPAEHVKRLTLPALLVENPGLLVDVCESNDRAKSREAELHLVDHEADTFTCKDSELVIRPGTELCHSLQRIAGLILYDAHSGNGLKHLNHEVYRHIADGLHKEREVRRSANCLVVGEDVGIGAVRRQ